MLKGININLKIIERRDLPILNEWVNDIDFNGEFENFSQGSLADIEKDYEKMGENQWYFIESKDGRKVGYIVHFKSKDCTAIGYMLVPEERGKGYSSEAVQIMVDYLFLHKNIVRIQAETHPANQASQRILEKAGFQKEGILRQSFFSRGVHRDTALWSILREEWKAPRILPAGYVEE